MKRLIITSVLTLFLLNLTYSEVPKMNLKTIDGETINTDSIAKMGKPVIVSFFATWCKPCLRELSAINEVYADWKNETGVELIAVSIDNAQNSDKVKSLVNGYGWEYSVWLDPNSDFKREMGVNLIPAVFVFYKGKVVHSKTGYTDGAEQELIDIVRELIEENE